MKRKMKEGMSMEALCGVDCCSECSKNEECGGCVKVKGHPFGGTCIAAECVKRGGFDEFHKVKGDIISEINSLNIPNLHIDDLNLLNGFFVNLEYKLANGQSIKLLEDNSVYWGKQIEIPESDRCYGVVADEVNILVSEYGCEGKDAEIIMYKKR